MKCLLLETLDKKRFFTKIQNRKLLKEYCRAFDAKIFIVNANIKKTQILELPKLVACLCDKNYKNEKVDFEIIK
jgi:hypothetical protein